MNQFLEVFKYYNQPLRGLFYMPARWSIVPFSKIESYIPKKGRVIDIGCGEGVMTTLLALTSKERKVLGIDTNSNKIKLAKNLTRNINNLKFEVKDALSPLPKTSGFILSDFLHHLPKKHHNKIYEKIYNSLEKGGVIVIKEIDTEDKIRSKVSRLFDFIFYPKEEINFIKGSDLKKTLSSIGFEVTMEKTKKWFPGSTTLFICKK